MARILHVITGLRTGGAEIMLHKLLSASSAQYQHSVISLGAPQPLTSRIADLGIPVHSLDLLPAAPNPFKIWRLRALARHIAPDLIMGWMYHGNLMASLAGTATGRSPVIWTIHSSIGGAVKCSWRTRAVIGVCARLSHRPSAMVYVSEVSRLQHESRGFHARSSVVIPNGTDCRKFAPDPKAGTELRKELGLDASSVLIGLVARLHPVKNHHGFLRAAAIVVRHHPHARFLLVGRDIETNTSLRRLVHELALGDRVLLQGERSDMPRVCAGLDIACCASWGETFSQTVGEAMACRVPCVVTDVGDDAYLVGETGISVPPGDVEALARALNEMISAGPAERSKLGAAARRRIEQNFSLPAIVARYEELYGRHIPSATSTLSKGMKDLDPALRT